MGFRYSRETQTSRFSRAAESDIRCTEFTHPAVHANGYIYIYVHRLIYKYMEEQRTEISMCQSRHVYSKTLSA